MSSNWNDFVMQVLSYIIKIIFLPPGRFRSGSDIWTAMLNNSSLFIAIGNATLGLVIPEWLLLSEVQSLTSFRVILSWLPGCGNTRLLFFIIGDNLFPGDVCLCLSPLNLETEICPQCCPVVAPVPLLLKLTSSLALIFLVISIICSCCHSGNFALLHS